MPISHVLDRTVIIKRMKAGAGFKRAIGTIGTVGCIIQPLPMSESNIMPEAAGRLFNMWTEVDEDIKEGDIAIDSNGKQYKVLNVFKRDYGSQVHKEYLMEGRKVQ